VDAGTRSGRARVVARHVATGSCGAATERFDLRRHARGSPRVEIAHEHRTSTVGGRKRGRAADATARTGDDGHRAVYGLHRAVVAPPWFGTAAGTR